MIALIPASSAGSTSCGFDVALESSTASMQREKHRLFCGSLCKGKYCMLHADRDDSSDDMEFSYHPLFCSMLPLLEKYLLI